jgi:hypothetical protein
MKESCDVLMKKALPANQNGHRRAFPTSENVLTVKIKIV